MSENISPEKPWQSSLVGSKEKLNTLFYNEKFSDLTISFPGHGIEYKAHKNIMAVSSSIFKGMLFGPMGIEGPVLELPDDNPEAFRIVLASCYEVVIEPSVIDVALDAFILADKYFMGQLGKKCAQQIGKLVNSENMNKVLEFATNFNVDSYLMEQLSKECAQHIYNFLNCENADKVFSHFNSDSLKPICLEGLKRKFQFDAINSYDILLILPPDWLHELLQSDIQISHLVFKDSWRYPDETILCEDKVIEILKSNCCSNPALKFSGCVSANVVRYLCQKRFVEHMRLSFITHQQVKEVITELQNWKRCSLHLRCSMIPADLLMQLPRKSTMQYLFISDVDDHGIEWVVSALCSLMPQDGMFSFICYPESKLTFSGIKTLITRMANACLKCGIIRMCSPALPSNRQDELREWVNSNLPCSEYSFGYIQLFDRNEDISGW